MTRKKPTIQTAATDSTTVVSRPETGARVDVKSAGKKKKKKLLLNELTGTRSVWNLDLDGSI